MPAADQGGRGCSNNYVAQPQATHTLATPIKTLHIEVKYGQL